jgi:hypothetical protein
MAVATVTTVAATGTPATTAAMKNINLCFDYEGLNVGHVVAVDESGFLQFSLNATDRLSSNRAASQRSCIAYWPFTFNRLLIKVRNKQT